MFFLATPAEDPDDTILVHGNDGMHDIPFAAAAIGDDFLGYLRGHGTPSYVRRQIRISESEIQNI
jgi:hypothetical protein